MLRMGLSPRLRGNLYSCHLLQHHAGSIPAPAGEPINSIAVFNAHQVYPRACGGNRLFLGQSGHKVRSIPAPAGEPRPRAPLSAR